MTSRRSGNALAHTVSNRHFGTANLRRRAAQDFPSGVTGWPDTEAAPANTVQVEEGKDPAILVGILGKEGVKKLIDSP